MLDGSTQSLVSISAAVGLTWSLLATSIFFWIASLVVVSKLLPIRLSVVVVTVKVLLVSSYFAWWSAGGWFIGGDDSAYWMVGKLLLESGENPLSVWFSGIGDYWLVRSPSAALYHWWNMFWMYCFGPNYFVPVHANVFVTTLSAFVLDRLMLCCGFTTNYRRGLAVFFLLHWDNVVWSSFMNIKEPLVTLLLLMAIYSVVQLKHNRLNYVGLLGVSIFLLFGIRFYLPALLAGAAAVYWILNSRRLIITTVFATFVASVVVWYYWNTLSLVERLIELSPVSVAKHFVKQFMSPLPWNITEPATYLVLPSILHLIFLPFTFFGVISILRGPRGKHMMLIVLIVLAGIVFYSLIPPLSSVRHGAPFRALWVIFEFHFIYCSLSLIANRKKTVSAMRNPI